MYVETRCVGKLINFNSVSFQEIPTPINEVVKHTKGCVGLQIRHEADTVAHTGSLINFKGPYCYRK